MPIFSDLKAYLYGLFGSSAADNSASTPAPPTQETPTSRTRLDNENSDTLLLPDGRKLGYAQYGSQTGRAVLYVHGHPGSRLDGAHLHDLGLKLGARIIAPDRPGMGCSSPHPDRTLLDHPKDLERLADHLKLESYGVLVRAAWHFRASSRQRAHNDHGTGSIRRWTVCARLRFCIT
jgi:alpha/beta hydrolase fold